MKAVLQTEGAISPRPIFVPGDFGFCSPQPISLYSPTIHNLLRNGGGIGKIFLKVYIFALPLS